MLPAERLAGPRKQVCAFVSEACACARPHGISGMETWVRARRSCTTSSGRKSTCMQGCVRAGVGVCACAGVGARARVCSPLAAQDLLVLIFKSVIHTSQQLNNIVHAAKDKGERGACYLAALSLTPHTLAHSGSHPPSLSLSPAGAKVVAIVVTSHASIAEPQSPISSEFAHVVSLPLAFTDLFPGLPCFAELGLKWVLNCITTGVCVRARACLCAP